MNNPFEYYPDDASRAAYSELISHLDTLKKSSKEEDMILCRELEEGKMLGVLIAEDSSGISHSLFAFSGQIGKQGFRHPDFVEPAFDYLLPDGHFKRKETEISLLNKEIHSLENDLLPLIKEEYEKIKTSVHLEILRHKERFSQSKMERHALRESSDLTEEEEALLIRRSQYEKAELKRIKHRLSDSLIPPSIKLRDALKKLEELKLKRLSHSQALQDWLFSNFLLLNAKGETKSLKAIFADTTMKIPPSGAGECCAPKLLQAAFRRGLTPISIAEFWHGKPKGGEVRIEGRHYPACRGKCLPILSWMMQGLPVSPSLNKAKADKKNFKPQILFENEWFCVVNKPSGMLSVAGKSEELSLEEWLSLRYNSRILKMAHRLDQDTSGLIIAAFNPKAYKTLQSLFASRKVSKQYVALLKGDYKSLSLPSSGRITLPISPDWLDRPRQKIDLQNGKEAVTEYEFISAEDGNSRIVFHPLTGRTHQLRVHAASSLGLASPIIGDRLYGTTDSLNPSRLHLHAQIIDFTFPLDGRHYHFFSPAPF